MHPKRIEQAEHAAAHGCTDKECTLADYLEEALAELTRLRAENEALRKGARLITEPLPADVARLHAELRRMKKERTSYKAKLVDDRWALGKDARRAERERIAKWLESAGGPIYRDHAAELVRALPDEP